MRRLLLPIFVVVVGFFAKSTHAQQEEETMSMPEIADRYKALETFARGMFYLETLYFDPDKVKQDKMVTYGLKGIVNELDPHTMLMPKRAFKQLTIDTQGKFGGVGIIVSQERGKLIVVSPIEDTPAAKAGVLSGDEIIAIDGDDLTKLKGNDSVDKMRGDPGSKIKLTVRRKDVAKPIEFVLTREVIKVKSVRSQALGDNILYTRITSFQENTAAELAAILKKEKAKIRGIVLDLRDNPGGLLDQSVKVVDLFIESGIIVSTVGRDPKRVEREFAHKRDTYSNFPIVVLMNGGSASASEIVAGALQDHERALIIGTRSFGKGSVQTLVSLPDGSGLKLTVARYYTPKDRSIQAKGIEPDIIVPLRKGQTKDGDKDAPERKESDLEHHIDSTDLSEMAKDQGMLKSLKAWPEVMQNDNQLVTGFTYLKGWNVFQPRKGEKSKLPGTKPKEVKKG